MLLKAVHPSGQFASSNLLPERGNQWIDFQQLVRESEVDVPARLSLRIPMMTVAVHHNDVMPAALIAV
jgi:hypothetical protein